MTIPTYQGTVRQGKVQLNQDANLPEGSQVVVLATDEWAQSSLLDPHLARRKANGWLVTYVGNVMAQQPQLQQVEGKLAWRFKAFLTLRGHSPQGPVGMVDVDAYSGEILTGEEAATEIIGHATTIARSLLSPE
jgi:hypothetical protein